MDRKRRGRAGRSLAELKRALLLGSALALATACSAIPPMADPPASHPANPTAAEAPRQPVPDTLSIEAAAVLLKGSATDPPAKAPAESEPKPQHGEHSGDRGK